MKEKLFFWSEWVFLFSGRLFSWAIPIIAFGIAVYLLCWACITDKGWQHVVFFLAIAALSALIGVWALRIRKKEWP